MLPFCRAGSALASQGAWARCCLYNYSLPWKTHGQAKWGDIPLFRTSPFSVFSFFCFFFSPCKHYLTVIDKGYPCPQVSGRLKLSVFSHSGSLSLLTPPCSLISSLPSHSSVAHKEIAVKFKQQRLGCLLVSAVLELKSPGWAYWVKTHRQCTSTTNCDAFFFASGFLLFPALASSPLPVLFLRFSFPHSMFSSGPACLPSPPFFPSSALWNAALQRHWLTGDAAAWAEEMEGGGGKEEEEKLLSTKEAEKHWKMFSLRSESQSSFVRATNEDAISLSSVRGPWLFLVLLQCLFRKQSSDV